MSNAPIIDDPMETDMEVSKETNVEKSYESNLRQPLRNEAKRSKKSNTLMLDPSNSNSDYDLNMETVSQNLALSFTTMLGTLHGMSLEDVHKMMDLEKNMMIELQNAIKAVSKVFKNSNREMLTNPQEDDMSGNEDILLNNPLIISNDKEIPVIPPGVENDPMSTSIDKEIPVIPRGAEKNSMSNSIDKEISVKPGGAVKGSINTSIDTEVSLNPGGAVNTSFNKNILVNLPKEEVSENSTISSESTTTSTSESSRNKIGDNCEIPIVLDNDNDHYEAEIIEIDSDDEEILKYKDMMSLEDIDCIEIDKDEFDVVVNAKRGGKGCSDDYETNGENFIPIAPSDGEVRRRSYRIRGLNPSKYARRKACVSDEENHPSKWRTDLPALPYISNSVLRLWSTGFLCHRDQWERLEYLGDKVLMFCVLRFATTKYLQRYTSTEIKLVASFLVTNKLLAAYSLTLGLDIKNQMQKLGITKKVADAFEAYIGAYYLSEGEAATTTYLDQLMDPLFALVLTNMNGKRDINRIMNVIANYFHMGFLLTMSKLK
ncbi:18739_t:CDS:2 [Funneliformis geosporum]|uniref:5585_t:CDS:1 n=1 Tax=Funneliformis geosporum TaxID=1117311 RepID=A0A9W4SKR6_9GLOM|nr:18739_t:CDS:2 [Funneliformis geosporum]CAI2171906.1 5585_t:CDS:2 [Funneliformis geosporum]